MTSDDLPTTLRGRLIEWGKVAGAASAMIVCVGLVWGLTFGPLRGLYRSEQEWRATITEALAELRRELTCPPPEGEEPRPGSLCDRLIEQIAETARINLALDAVLRPTEVFTISESLSGAVGPCVERERCAIEVVYKRLPQGLLCRLVEEESPRFFVLNVRTGEQRQVLNLSPAPLVNLGEVWTPIPVEFDTPARLATSGANEPPNAALVMERTFDQCLGPGDDVRVVSRSDKLIGLTIIAATTPATDPQGATP